MLAETILALLPLTAAADVPTVTSVGTTPVVAVSNAPQGHRWWWNFRPSNASGGSGSGSPLPEPATMSLLALAGAGAAVGARRSRKARQDKQAES